MKDTKETTGTEELVRLMLQREAKALKKEEEDELRLQLAREHDLQVAQEEIRNKKARQDACTHTKENGKSAIFGQVHSDSMYHPLCVRCFKEFPPRKPTPDQLQMGVG